MRREHRCRYKGSARQVRITAYLNCGLARRSAIIFKQEYDELMKGFNDFINPIKEEKISGIPNFQDKIFCLTGTFNSGSKESIEKRIIEKGGICGKGVTTKTDYLIVGGSGSDAWKFGNYGGKVQKAMELKEKGKNIEIISEDEFLKNL